MESDEPPSSKSEIEANIAKAKARLWRLMIERGLTEDKGWRILEGLRPTADGEEYVFRPVHLQEKAEGLEVTLPVRPRGGPA
jgi:hypothetical protein